MTQQPKNQQCYKAGFVAVPYFCLYMSFFFPFQNCNMRKSIRAQYVYTVDIHLPAVACFQFYTCTDRAARWMCSDVLDLEFKYETAK